MCALLTELAESKKRHSECQDEVKTTAASLFKLIFFLFSAYDLYYHHLYEKVYIPPSSKPGRNITFI